MVREPSCATSYRLSQHREAGRECSYRTPTPTSPGSSRESKSASPRTAFHSPWPPAITTQVATRRPFKRYFPQAPRDSSSPTFPTYGGQQGLPWLEVLQRLPVPVVMLERA